MFASMPFKNSAGLDEVSNKILKFCQDKLIPPILDKVLLIARLYKKLY